MTIRPLIATIAAVSFLLVGCSSVTDAPVPSPSSTSTQGASVEESSKLLADYGLTGMDARAAIEHLDRLGGADRPADLMASIRADELLLSAGTVATTLPMPDESFYVSIAPYVTQTHECFYHSLTTCQGEMVLADVHVTVTDDATGETILDEEMTTYENGFVGLWLPRDMTGTITITADGSSVESPISTTADSATCLTTLQLA